MAGQRYLLDTNIFSSLLKQPAGEVARRIAAVGEGSICTSIVVACELRYGAEKKGSAALTERVEALLTAVEVLPFEDEADRACATIRTALERAGTPIGANDMLIAAHATALGLTLVTDNTREFLRVQGLAVENWLE